MRQEPTSLQFKIAKAIVFNNVKKALGLDQCKFFLFGAAPMDPAIRNYFLTLNIPLINSYGMSESTGPQNFTDQTSLDYLGPPEAFREVGRNLPGTQITIIKTNESEEDGRIKII
jgi:long-chain-fatty-acid--CoA ligase ACSBG